MNLNHMKSYLYHLGIAIIFLCGMSGCEKETMVYEGEDALYFDVRSNLGAHEYFTAVPFGSLMEDDREFNVGVAVSGYPKDYDREFRVIANPDSTTAQNGRDYEGLQQSYVIKAGETSTSIKLTAHRTEAMSGDTLLLQLKLVENEHFKLLYTDYGDSPNRFYPDDNKDFANNHNAAFHNIYLYDVPTKPKGWWRRQFGTFSGKKWRLMMQVTGTKIEDYDNILTTMPLSRADALSEKFARYLLEQAKSKETAVIDEDGTMMYVSYVTTLGGSSAWSAGTKPEDCDK